MSDKSATAILKPNDSGSLPDELDSRLRAHHKALFTRILLPTVTVVTLFLIIVYWRFDTKFYLGLGVVALVDVFNVYFSLSNRHIATPWGVIESRSDAFDTFRWCINFVLDAFIAWSFEAPAASIFAAWVILTFGAQTEVYGNKNKLFTTLVSLACLVALFSVVNPVAVMDQLFLVACFISVQFIFWRLEVSLVKEMQEYFRERIRRERVEVEAEKMQRDAAVGNSVRSLTHEINNLTAIAALTSAQIRGGGGGESEELERLDRSLELMTKTSCLVLDDLGGYCATIRNYTLEQLQRDTQLLLSGLAMEERIPVYYDFPEMVEDVVFIERSGSTYLIIHNLAKNGFEAIREKFGDQSGGRLEISVGIEAGEIIISVGDNGAGMPEQQVDAVLAGMADTSKPEGHGLGMRFVHRECQENGYRLGAESTIGEGSRFVVYVPCDDACPAT